MRLRLDSDRSAARLRNRPSERGGAQFGRRRSDLDGVTPQTWFPRVAIFCPFPRFREKTCYANAGVPHVRVAGGSLATLSVALSCLAWKGREEGRGKSSGRKGMAQRAERGGESMAVREEERGAGSPRQGRPTKANRYRVAWRYTLEVVLM